MNKSIKIKEKLSPQFTNFVLIGDILLDTLMIGDIKYENLLKIGFFNNPQKYPELESEFKKHYDVII